MHYVSKLEIPIGPSGRLLAILSMPAGTHTLSVYAYA